MADHGPGQSRPDAASDTVPDAGSAIASAADLAGELRRVLCAAEAREGRTLGRAGLAKRIGVSQSSLYAYLNGTTLIPVDALSTFLRELEPDRQLALRLRKARQSLTEPMAVPDPVLPLDVPSFVARAEHLAELDRLRGQGRKAGTATIAVVSGIGGIGKTSLAVRWAHQRLSRFPDGCLYLDLRGFHPDSPREPREALATLLRGLGVPGTGMPSGLEERRERYLQLLAGKRMLILLDNAFSAEQVRPLLPPGNSTCFVLITSRDKLSGLVIGSGAHPVPMRALPEEEARALLAARLGEARIEAEPAAAARIVAVCAGMPLALGAVAGRAQMNPRIALEALADELEDAGTRLRVLDEGDAVTGVGTVLSWSLAALTQTQARVFALLGLAPGADITVPAAASLTDLPPDQVKAVLQELERVSLVCQEKNPGRFRMHDLVRHYAAETARRGLEPEVGEAAVCRIVDFYVHTAYAADIALDPHRPRIEMKPPVSGVRIPPPADRIEAIAWFDAEHENLMAVQRAAAVRQWPLAVWHLARALSEYQNRRGRRNSRLALWQNAAAAAEHIPDPAFIAQTHRALAYALADLGRQEEAIAHLDLALASSEQLGDLAQQAMSHLTYGRLCGLTEDYEQALAHVDRSRALFRKLGNAVGEAHALSGCGWYLAHLGDYQTAREYCELAQALFREHGSLQRETSAMDTLGYIYHQTGDYRRAIDQLERTAELMRTFGDDFNLADTLSQQGQSHAALDQRDEAREIWQAARELYLQQGRDEEATRVQRYLDELDRHDDLDVDLDEPR